MTAKKFFSSKNIISFFIFIVLISQLNITFGNNKITTVELFSDVPVNHYSFNDIHQLRLLGITEGVGNNRFGFGRSIKRSEFITFLVKLLNLDIVNNDKESFDDVKSSDWFFPYVETALSNNIISNENFFRPNDPITREEIVKMIVNSLGYKSLAEELDTKRTKFLDVEYNKGYINIAFDLGIISGINKFEFAPLNTAKREEAAAMIMRMYNKLNFKIKELNGFYAINSYDQVDLGSSFDSIGFGWSSIDFDDNSMKFYLNTEKKNNNEYSIPQKYYIPLNKVKNYDNKKLLMVFSENKKLNDGIKLLDKLLSDSIQSDLIIEDLIKNIVINKNEYYFEFDGVIIDFELLKGDENKYNFNKFLYKLNKALKEKNKLLYVAVHPPLENSIYFDGYDYKTIGEIADKVILMSHDYAATTLSDSEMNSGFYYTPITPIKDIYYALSYITDIETGIKDKEKIMLQFSMAGIQWKLKDDKIVNKYAYPVSYEKLFNRFNSTDINISYSEKYKNPIAEFYTNDGYKNIVWYEDERSIEDKIKLANMFGINNFSIWRLGTIPNFESKNFYLNIWSLIESYKN